MSEVSNNNWQIADLVELIPGNYFSESRRSWIYGYGYIEDIYINKQNIKIYKVIIFNAIKQQVKNFAEMDIGEYVITASESEMNTWFRLVE